MAARWRIVASDFALALIVLATSTVTRAETPALPAPPTAAAALASISYDTATAARQYHVRNWLREHLVSDRDLARYCLRLDDDWRSAPIDRPIAVLIHGFNSTPSRTAGVLVPIRDAHFPCATFAYANDYFLPAAAESLSKQLHQLARDYPSRRVALVCHSTGGLVARACIEDPALDPGNVDQLIMIAPPTHGSQLARFAVGTDVWEHWLSRKDGWPWTRVHDSIVDGLGEAADELCPGSDFLTHLNARHRNPRVRYSILLGTRSALSDGEVAWIRENVCEKLKELPGVDGRAERLEALLDDIDELVDGKGDGVVAVKRGRLKGVDDTVVLPFCHMAIGGKTPDDEASAVYREVLQRLQARADPQAR